MVVSPELTIEDIDNNGQSERDRRAREASTRARKNWKKAGNLAIAVKRFERSGRERSGRERKPRSRSTTPVPTPSNANTGVVTGGSETGYNTIRVSPKGQRGGQLGSPEEIERCRKARGTISAFPGPQVKNGRFTSKGVHAVRWKEKLRGLSLVTNHIVLGGRDEANNKGMLDKYGVTHVLNTSKQVSQWAGGEDSTLFLTPPLPLFTL